MRTLTKLSKAPDAAPDTKAPDVAPEQDKTTADVSADSAAARHELDGRIKGAGPLARDTLLYTNTHPIPRPMRARSSMSPGGRPTLTT